MPAFAGSEARTIAEVVIAKATGSTTAPTIIDARRTPPDPLIAPNLPAHTGAIRPGTG
jgi:hypothetical protein